jgi:chromosome segregation ATPase
LKLNYEEKISSLNLEISDLKGKLKLASENTQDMLEQLEKSKNMNKSLRSTMRETTNEEVEQYKKLSENYKSQCEKLKGDMKRLEEKTLKMVELVKKERQNMLAQQKNSSSPPPTKVIFLIFFSFIFSIFFF